MFQQMSDKIASKMVNEKIIDPKMENVYSYGLELLLSTVTGVLTLTIISILGSEPFLWLPYLAGFIPIRLTGGGYHAHSHRNCILAFATIYLITFNVCRSIPNHIWIVGSIVNLIIIIMFSPVEANNKPLKEKQRKFKRAESLFLGVINLAIIILITLLQLECTKWINLYYAGNSMASLSLLVAVIIKNLNKEEQP